MGWLALSIFLGLVVLGFGISSAKFVGSELCHNGHHDFFSLGFPFYSEQRSRLLEVTLVCRRCSHHLLVPAMPPGATPGDSDLGTQDRPTGFRVIPGYVRVDNASEKCEHCDKHSSSHKVFNRTPVSLWVDIKTREKFCITCASARPPGWGAGS